MNCAEAAGIISEYLDGHLSTERKQALELHLALCEHCATEVERTRAMVASLRDLSEPCPVDCTFAVMSRLNARPQRMRWWQWVMRPVVAAPAAAVLGGLALFLAWPSGPAPLASDEKFAAEYKYYIGAHYHLQRQQAFADPDVVFMRAELQKASLVADAQ